eukprot:g76188.t1
MKEVLSILTASESILTASECKSYWHPSNVRLRLERASVIRSFRSHSKSITPKHLSTVSLLWFPLSSSQLRTTFFQYYLPSFQSRMPLCLLHL